jgi:hypothetical protein
VTDPHVHPVGRGKGLDHFWTSVSSFLLMEGSRVGHSSEIVPE